MSTEVSQRQAAESPGPQRTPAAVADNAVALSAGATVPAWSDSPRQLKQAEQLTQLQPAAAPASHGGLPENLRSGIEALSGIDMSGVRVHRNSSKPAALQAHAYAQGQDIHLGPGQEKHLPHEAWHVVQQAQGRVRPTVQMEAGVPVNDAAGLEREADKMGAQAAQVKASASALAAPRSVSSLRLQSSAPAQRLRIGRFNTEVGADREDVINELLKLNINSLLTVAEQLHEENGLRSSYYIEWIHGHLSKLQLDEATASSSINVSILVAIDGVPRYSTKTYKAGTGSSRTFSMPPERHRHREDAEYKLSAKDAEAQAADEAWRFINTEFPLGKHYKKGVGIVTFTVIGNYGPCDGCKDRIELLRALAEKRVAVTVGEHGIPVTVERVYKEDVVHKTRGKVDRVPTTYGFDSDSRVPIFGFTHNDTLPKPEFDWSKPLDNAISYSSSSSYPMSSYSLPEAPKWPSSPTHERSRFDRFDSDDERY